MTTATELLQKIIAQGDAKRVAQLQAFGISAVNQHDLREGDAVQPVPATADLAQIKASLHLQFVRALTAEPQTKAEVVSLACGLLKLACSSDVTVSGQQCSVCSPALSRVLLSWLEQLAQEDSAKTPVDPSAHWLGAALAQLVIYQQASSPEVAKQLLGPGAVQQTHLR